MAASSFDLSQFTTRYHAARKYGLPHYALTMGIVIGRVRTLQLDGKVLVHLEDAERLAAERQRSLAPQPAA
jgi:hypothetical protein